MKKLFLIFFFSVGALSYSQIRIDSSHMPRIGDTLRYSTALLDTAILLNYQTAGANLTWNFDSLRPISQTVQSFLSSTQTPYSNEVPQRIGLLFADTLRFGGFAIYDAYNFINNSASDFSIDWRGTSAPTGLSFPFPTTVKLVGSYTDKDEVFQFPLEYQDHDSSTFDFLYTNSLLGIYYGSRGYRINHVDAWGTVSTPYGTFNTIRVVTDMVSFDTISFSGQNFGIPSHTREYQWISDLERIPVMKVNGQVFGGVFIPTTVEYRDSVREITPFIPSRAFFRSDTNVIDINDTLDFTNLSIGGLDLNFKWSFNPDSVIYRSGSPTSRNISVSFLDTGFYDVQLIAKSGTSVDTMLRINYIQVIGSLGIEKLKNQLSKNIQLYPNPRTHDGYINLKLGDDLVVKTVQILDAKGLIYSVKNINSRVNYLQLMSPTVSGVYFIKITTEKGIALKKLIIE